MKFYEEPRFMVPKNYFDEEVFKEQEVFYLSEDGREGMFAKLILNLGKTLVFVTGYSPPWEISIEDAADEKIYIGKIVMEESA